MKKIIYYINEEKFEIRAKVLKNPLEKSFGLMFKSSSPPLLFTKNTISYLPITSIFCKPFKAIWLDKNFHATKVLNVTSWKFFIPGSGKYLLEIPIPTTQK